jgi:dTMP kinase|tara:strand:- start:519 stop:1181 length:663 start_codon:yes stop_codon:yes gene_type:complete
VSRCQEPKVALKGKFVSFEGGDGAGKSTQISLLSRSLTDIGISPVLTREPGGTRLSEEIRQWILHEPDAIDPVTEVLLIFAARAQHTVEVIVPALEDGRWVLCDRFTDASYAYQGGGRGLPFEVIESLEAVATRGLRPDLTIFLDLSVEEGVRRSGGRGSSRDRFEAEELEFKHRVRSTYQEFARKNPERIKSVDASESIEEVHAQVKSLMHHCLGVSID